MHANARFRSEDREKIPRGLLRAIGLMVVLSLGLAGYARWTDAPLSAAPSASPEVVGRDIVIVGGTDGAAKVTAPDGTVILQSGPGEAGFISGVGRAMARVRDVAGAQFDAPARLSLHADRSLRLTDPATGWRVELKAFGKDNEAAFAALLPPPPAAGETREGGKR